MGELKARQGDERLSNTVENHKVSVVQGVLRDVDSRLRGPRVQTAAAAAAGDGGRGMDGEEVTAKQL